VGRSGVGVDAGFPEQGVDGDVGLDFRGDSGVEALDQANLFNAEQRAVGGGVRGILLPVVVLLGLAADAHVVGIDVVEQVAGHLPGVVAVSWDLPSDFVEDLLEECHQERFGFLAGFTLFLGPSHRHQGVQVEPGTGIFDGDLQTSPPGGFQRGLADPGPEVAECRARVLVVEATHQLGKPMMKDDGGGDVDSSPGECFCGGDAVVISRNHRVDHAAAQKTEDRRTEYQAHDQNHRQHDPSLGGGRLHQNWHQGRSMPKAPTGTWVTLDQTPQLPSP